jgi:transglutaminase-like putative cysteine protease
LNDPNDAASWKEAAPPLRSGTTRFIHFLVEESAIVRWNLGIITFAVAFAACHPVAAGDNPSNATAPKRDGSSSTTPKATAAMRSRTFDLSYEVAVTSLEKGKLARIWVPVAQTNNDQDVELMSQAVRSGEKWPQGKFTTETEYGNRLFFVETDGDAEGKVGVTLSYRVTRREVKSQTGQTMKEDAEKIQRFLRADRLVPIDGKPLALLDGKTLPDDPVKKARVLYDVVNEHMKYDKSGTGWGKGDSVWACDSKYGNCSDFHSLFISLARSQRIPAKFEMGFAIPTKRGEGTIAGYHCWAFFRPRAESKAWVPVDISEANKDPKMKDYFFGNLTEDRVTFTTGRDLVLEPKQSGKPVNFLISPYVEVDGKEYDEAKIEKKVSYKDVKE